MLVNEKLSGSRLLALLAVVALMLAACGGDDVAPSEDSSSGDNVRFEQPAPAANNTDDGPCMGCLEDDNCRSGNTEAACGEGGAVCAACDGDEVCMDGECTAPMSGDCGPDNCDGCCSDGQCVTGGADDACGLGGGVCSACAASEQCNAGVCEDGVPNNNVTPDPCGPANCNGCCDAAGTCVGGTAASACGVGGGQCNDCAAAGDSCNAGVCEAAPPSCAMSCQGCCVGETCITATDDAQCGAAGAACMACGANEMCSGGACVMTPPPGDRWQIVVVSAAIPSTKLNGDSWDPFGGYPDVVVGVAAEDPFLGTYDEDFTSVAVDQLNPVWNEVVLTNLTSDALANGVGFYLFDDELAIDDICLQLEVVDTTTINPGQNIVTTCDTDAWVDWTWRIERYP